MGWISSTKCGKSENYRIGVFVQKVGGVAIANHKTGNEIQIMPKEDADRLYTLSQRQGYGVSKGIKGVRK